ncbi:ATP-dependent DNA helicase [Fibrella aquatilis]|uniref:AAA family ATPase n=1 Tax=Fibrella aquatilis TaxID=2817059 RepID=A0A939GA21_9BACT|nr:AAA family ATPase [Fibrella aquatilis]MBO0932553.1 AAA family ATPase [Fibrella aquatilis]
MTTTTATIFDLLPFAPTTEQAQFLFEIEEFMESDEDFFMLRGSAGTGKTSIAKAVVDHLTEQQIPCFLSAPTTRAARIIGRKTEREARTLHSRIYLIEPLEDGRVKTSLKVNDDTLPTLYIVDESSMISDRVTDDDKFIASRGLLYNFLHYVKNGNKRSKVLFIGDVYQLPPVGYEAGQTPPALSESYLRGVFGLSGRVVELTDVKRQAEGSSILRSATSLRDAMRFGRSWQIESEHFWGPKGAVDGYLRAFNPRRLDSVVYIAHYHKSLTRFNTDVRQQLGRTDTLAVGDVIVFHQNFVGTDYTAFNGDFGTVVELVSGVERFGGLHFQQVMVELTDERGQLQRVAGKVCLEFTQAEKPELMREQENVLYSEVMRTDKAFRESKYRQNYLNPYLGAMRLRYGYGITSYKAQGSEFDTVLLNTWAREGKTNLNYLYTGVTRARERLICSV